jgi:NADH dehydrogenase
VIVGGGFGGLQCAKALQDQPVDVLLVDERDYHLFTPLLYQVASCLLNPSEVAAPLRKVFRHAANVRYREGLVAHCNLEQKTVLLTDGTTLEYDHLVLATGSVPNFYGNAPVEERALGIKDLASALQLRNHVLECLEQATRTDDPATRERLLTFCIVGAGPTGVEYAGALAEFARLVVPAEYPELAPSSMRILLLEGGDRVLPTFARSLSEYARRELVRRRVDVRTAVLVDTADDTGVVLHDGTEITSATLVWTAGVRPADLLHTPPRRVEVDDRLRIVGARDAYAIGDVAAAHGRRDDVLPMLSPVAMQGGRHVAREILGRATGRPFRYRDKGTLATIGRTSAVGQVGPFRFTGLVGWIVWLVVHLYYLIGFENRLQVLMRWAWYYIRLDRPVRIIVRAHEPPRRG